MHRCYTDVVRVRNQTEARAALARSSATVAVVDRDGPRSVLFSCPCGCGDIVVINVDRRAGKSWRFREDERGLTLMPSVWRTTGCRSHFVLWHGSVWWCHPTAADVEWPAEMDSELSTVWSEFRSRKRRSRS